MSDETIRGEKSKRNRKPPHERAATQAAVEAIKEIPGLFAQYETLREALNQATADELTSRYVVGTIVGEVQSGPGGKRGVKLLATVLGEPVSPFYEARDVVITFPPDRLEEIQKLSNAYGRFVSYTHLLILTRVKSAPRREQLLDRVVREGLNTRELLSLISRGPISITTNDAVVTVRKTIRLVRLLGRQAAGLVHAFQTLPADDEVRGELVAAWPELERSMNEIAGHIKRHGGQRGEA